MNNAAMGMRFYTAVKPKNKAAIGSEVGGGTNRTGAMRGDVGYDESYFMVQRARAAATEKPTSKAATYKMLGGVAEQRIPGRNVLDTTYGVRVGGVYSSMEYDAPQTRINSDAVKVWQAQLQASKTFEMDRSGEWTGRPTATGSI